MSSTTANRLPRAGVSTPLGPSARRSNSKRRALGLLVLAMLFLVALIDWLSGATTRLYVDQDSAASEQQGTVWQHFAVRETQVVPEIISADEARFTFPISLGARHVLQFTAHPEGPAEYQILLRTGTAERRIASAKINRSQTESLSLPAGKGDLQFVVHGRIAWFDLRLTRQFHWPVYLSVFILALFALTKTSPIPHPASRVSNLAGNWLTLGASTVVCLALIELVFRAMMLKLPTPVLTARHELGLAAPDPRWVDSPRYKQRLRANLKTYCEWWHGDIVRMGFLPPDVFGGEHHRYPFETDAEGFRNPAVRQQVDVAVLGDSFADAMTSPREESWPARLEQITGRIVHNYGTSAFGPQQELYALEDFVVQRRPRDVVLGYFAGNDIFDAERFDNWEQGADKPGEEKAGWRLKKNFRRYETLFLTTIIRVAFPAASPQENAPRTVVPTTGPSFDRGAYNIPVAEGTVLRFAFMPPYLQKLASTREEIERSRGWQLTRDAIAKMRDLCGQHRSRLTVLFIPSKAEVYWPLVERSLAEDELQRSLDFVNSYNHMPIRAADIRANRLAQNELMREFCATSGILFLDLTPALEQAAAPGRAVYFADDAHWNAAGHELAAQELARFLAAQP